MHIKVEYGRSFTELGHAISHQERGSRLAFIYISVTSAWYVWQRQHCKRPTVNQTFVISGPSWSGDGLTTLLDFRCMPFTSSSSFKWCYHAPLTGTVIHHHYPCIDFIFNSRTTSGCYGCYVPHFYISMLLTSLTHQSTVVCYEILEKEAEASLMKG